MSSVEIFCNISHQILSSANQGLSKADFVKKVLKLLASFSKSNEVELRLRGKDKYYSFKIVLNKKNSFKFKIITPARERGCEIPCKKNSSGSEQVCRLLLSEKKEKLPSFFSDDSFYIGDTDKDFDISKKKKLYIGGIYKSICMIKFLINKKDKGLIIFKAKKKNFFSKSDVSFYVEISKMLGEAFAHQRAQADLKERIKEMSCINYISKVIEKDMSLENILKKIVNLLPPAFLYPEITSARIKLDDKYYLAKNFEKSSKKLTHELKIKNKKRGFLEVVYKNEDLETPFLKEEENLVESVAKQISLTVEKKEAEFDKIQLQEQLRHADRLATIGQLSAGVAHEINEPLGSILGFAQLTLKEDGIPKQVTKDIEKIINASLYAREIIRKLMLFARQTPPKKNKANLNKLIKEGIYFLEARCAKQGIELELHLSRHLPEITADKSQLYQVLINLLVNSIQAMPKGGNIKITTKPEQEYVNMSVEDTGMGMPKDITKKIFLPFFTTKDINEGTGLGLAVVHGIITSHKGKIEVQSEIGKGTCFNIKLPIHQKY